MAQLQRVALLADPCVSDATLAGLAERRTGPTSTNSENDLPTAINLL